MRRRRPRSWLGRGLAVVLIAASLAANAIAADAPAPTSEPAQAQPPAPAPAPAPGNAPAAPNAEKPPAETKPEGKPEAKPEAKPENKPESAPPLPLETVDLNAAMPLLGKKVRDATGADMGLVVDVLIDHGGGPVAAVIDVGGFLGVGSRKIAVDWHLLQFHPEDTSKAPVVVPLDRAQVQAAPEYKPSATQVKIVRAPIDNHSGTDTGK